MVGKLPLVLGSKTNLRQANLPNLRRLFVEARTEVEENEYSRTAVLPPYCQFSY